MGMRELTKAGSALSLSSKMVGGFSSHEFNAKRRPGKEVGVESWYSYYAGFTEGFAKSAILAAELPVGSKILDPWNGCGTTTKVADSLGYSAIGFDINPVATLVASAKLARASDALYVIGLASRLAKGSFLEEGRVKNNDPLRGWLCPAVIRTYRAIERGVLENLADRDGKALKPSEVALPPLASFLMLALLRSARELSGVQKTSNPTWMKKRERPPKYRPEDLCVKWIANLREMGENLIEVEERPSIGSKVSLGDSRLLPLEDSTIDLVVTSPPYCTRIDYVVSTSFELAALGVHGDKSDYDMLRRKSMGTPLARKGCVSPSLASFPDGVASILESIKRHPSKSSESYYFKTYAQYFSDSMLSIKELRRVLKPGGVAALVVQSSYYKDVYVNLPELYVEMAQSLSLNSEIAVSYDVSRFLSQINSRSSKYREKTKHSEAVVIMEAI
ncbi:DNA methyltransferase [Franzmannia qiaohouensis]|uniref:site-specific DNA-methyltransferase (cytosine-N(4)-specific) n=1 Tax=Franzmannia qiaohouensis TaxID=1329370 RepID=A0ABU1HCX2_9GAMM|nr:DNA methyltransferase [Halomonas qiaohouensis]MDR5904470.1 DNA methyltransferase [Halomonas qiaohouensis]